jgi:hypothetical protein
VAAVLRGECVGDELQNLVADSMSVPVVDAFEVIYLHDSTTTPFSDSS